ncbi:MAG: prephenate dehydrogenase [Spirochaetota bacterium]
MITGQHFNRIAIVGVGLLGGSIGLALKERSFKCRITGIGRDEKKLVKAQSSGIIDAYSTSIESETANADLVVICTPVCSIAEIYKKIYPFLRSDTLVTDVGSTKHKLLKDISKIEKGQSFFIGSHPMAGSEKNGHEAASANLFNRSIVAVINDKNTSQENLKKINAFWEFIGAIVVNLTSAEHDKIVSETSHVPHLISCLTAYACMKSSRSKDLFNNIYANGLLDLTRLSQADPSMWMDIFSSNRENILNVIKKYKKHFALIEKLLSNKDYDKFNKLLRDVKTFRENLSSNKIKTQK